jgi:putative aldouronate transport system substrate-binding protein
VEDFDTNLFTKWYEEQTNVHIEWIVAPSNEANEKLNLLLSSGDLPDVILLDLTPAQQRLYGEQGILISLNDLIEKDGVQTKKAFEAFPEIKDRVTAPDGKIYGLPEVNQCYHCSMAQKLWIYQPWLDKLGLKMPTTTEEFEQVLKAFKEKDPNGNGKADEIPLASATDMWNGNLDLFLMNAFTLNPDNHLVLNDGKIEVTYNKPEYREGLRYLRHLYEEGLIAPESFTQNAEQLKLLGSGDTVTLGAVSSALSGYWADWGTERNQGYVTVPPLKGPAGVQVTPFVSVYGGGKFFITKAAKNPEVAFKWADALYIPEVELRAYYGVNGQNWRWAEPGEKGIDGRPAVFAPLDDGPKNAGWSQANQSSRPNEFRFGEKRKNDTDVEPWLYEQTKKMEPYKQDPKTTVPLLFYNTEQAQEIAELQATTDKYVTEMLARFITGDADIEADWDTYVKTLDKQGLPQLLEIQQAAYDAKYKK